MLIAREKFAKTPTDESYCIVSREYKKSDQRVYEVPCPHCGKAAGLQQLLPKVGEKEGPALKFRADPTTGKVLTYVDEYGNECQTSGTSASLTIPTRSGCTRRRG